MHFKFITSILSLLLGFSTLYADTTIIGSNSPQRVENQFIIILKEDAILQNVNANESYEPYQIAKDIIESLLPTRKPIEGIYGFKHLFKTAPYGAIVNTLSTEDLDDLLKDNRIELVTYDFTIYNNPPDIQYSPPNHLDRIDQWSIPLESKYTYPYDGSGVNVYILDSGINASHNEFGSINVSRHEFVDFSESLDDDTGHGTHVAGIIAGSQSGVAKNAFLHSVKYRGATTAVESNLLSATLMSLDFISENFELPAVLNISQDLRPTVPGVATGSITIQIVEKINFLVNNGVVIVASAGNYQSAQCALPASMNNVISVGAIDEYDHKAWFSNYGHCVDIYAPGFDVLSANFIDNSSLVDSSGTSMASPMVAGAAALYLDMFPNAAPAQVKEAILNNSSEDEIISGLDVASHNRILNITRMFDPNAYTPDSFENDDKPSAISIGDYLPFSGDPFYQIRNFGDDSIDVLIFSSLALTCADPVTNDSFKGSCNFQFSSMNSMNTNIKISAFDDSEVYVPSAQLGQTYNIERKSKGWPIKFTNSYFGTPQPNSTYRVNIHCGCFQD